METVLGQLVVEPTGGDGWPMAELRGLDNKMWILHVSIVSLKVPTTQDVGEDNRYRTLARAVRQAREGSGWEDSLGSWARRWRNWRRTQLTWPEKGLRSKLRAMADKEAARTNSAAWHADTALKRAMEHNSDPGHPIFVQLLRGSTTNN